MGTVSEDMTFSGYVGCKTINVQNPTITDAMISPSANIQTGKLQHRYSLPYAQPNTAAATETKGIFVQNGALGTSISFEAGSIGQCIGAATITIDLHKNGASVLSAPIVLTSSSAIRTLFGATFSSVTNADGDWFEIVVTAAAGGGTLGTGVFVRFIVDETAT